MFVVTFLLLLLWCIPAMGYSIATGFYTTVASPPDGRDVPVTPSFPIHALIIKCEGTDPAYMTISGMGADESKELAVATDSIGNQIQSLGTGTFQLGSGIGTQPASSTCYYVAFGDDGKGDFAYGSRSGNSTDNFDYTVPGFQPDFFLTFCYAGCVAGMQGRWRTSAHTGDDASSLAATANAANAIQGFHALGPTLGTDAEVNATGTTYAWIALKLVSTYNLSGSHIGNTTDLVDIPAIANPTFILAKAESNTAPTCGRWGTSGDLSFLISASAAAINRVQAFTSTGFQRGTGTCISEDTIRTYWWTSKQPLYSSAKKQRSVTLTGGF